MTREQFEKLFDALDEIVNDVDSHWRDKHDYIMGQIDEREKTILGEFIAWFTEEELN